MKKSPRVLYLIFMFPVLKRFPRQLCRLRWRVVFITGFLTSLALPWVMADPPVPSPSTPALKTPAPSTKRKKEIITLAVLGPRAPVVSAQAKPQDVVRTMINHWRGRLAQVLPDRPDLIVVPEACDRPRGLSSEKVWDYYNVRKDQVLDFFRETARQNKCYMIYSAVRAAPDDTWRNASVLIDRTGRIVGAYHKNHPTIGEIEKDICCGARAPVFECDFGRVAMAICFDLNFDELRQKYVKAKPDLILFSSMYHGGLMQAYWAYSCRAHFVGAVAGLPCEIRNPLGQIVAHTTNYFDFVVTTINLDCRLAHLDYNWQRLRNLKKKYGPQVTITDPGFLGSVLITSQHESIGALDMIREFDIELLDEYLPRALTWHQNPLYREKGDQK